MGESMNPIDDAKTVLDMPQSQPVLSQGEWMSIMQALAYKTNGCMMDLKDEDVVFYKEYLKKEIKINNVLYKKLKEAGYSES